MSALQFKPRGGGFCEMRCHPNQARAARYTVLLMGRPAGRCCLKCRREWEATWDGLLEPVVEALKVAA